jgi:molybdenum cofactor biosynthesis enzyme MoaA
VNISLNSLDAEKYEEMVGRKNMSTRVRAAISAFRAKYPDVHMIFNTTLIKGFNYILEDMVKIISFANEVVASIKFIELFPMKAENFVSLQKVQELLTVLEFSSVESNSQRKVVLSNGPMSVALTRILCSQAILSETPSEFCYRNNDLFISPDGSIKPCRELLQEVHLLEPIKDRDRLQTADQIKEALLAIGKNCQYNEP